MRFTQFMRSIYLRIPYATSLFPSQLLARGLRKSSRFSFLISYYIAQILYGFDPDTRRFLGFVKESWHSGVLGHAQMLQDLWVLGLTNSRRGGTFVDVGACMPVKYSNTYLLEQEMEWGGLLIEPNPVLAAELRKERGGASTVVLEVALGMDAGTSQLVEYGPLSSLLSTSDRDIYRTKRAKRKARTDGLVAVEVQKMEDVLQKLEGISSIEYLSIDVEGADFDVLKTFPFGTHSVDLITIEHNLDATVEKEIDHFLAERNYRRVMKRWASIDSWYVHESRGIQTV